MDHRLSLVSSAVEDLRPFAVVFLVAGPRDQNNRFSEGKPVRVSLPDKGSEKDKEESGG